jgi:hypothetical protein
MTMKVRILIAVAVLVSGVVHLTLWFEGFSSTPVIGPAFLFNAVAAVVIAVLLLVWRHWVPLFLALGFGASTLGAYLTSATVGLFGVHEPWTGGAVITAAVSEIVAIVTSAVALWRGYRRSSLAQTPQPSAAVHPLRDR